MILDNTQWITLQKTVQKALPFFRTYKLFPEVIKSFERVSGASLYELQQIRTVDDWPKFLEDLKEDERVSLALIVNFANGYRDIDWPYWSSENYDKWTGEFKDNLSKGEEWSKSWVLNHEIFIKRTIKSFLHIDPSLYGKGIWYSRQSELGDGAKHEEWGLVISEINYVPISVEF